ncbi:MAG TPA: hypothetical protein VGR11_10075 [Solirubrobacteraceae bacterium]|nr:hypothetical protein [Solirubrobacteraceae bacterium]
MSNTKNTIKISTPLPNIRDLAGPTILDGALPDGFTTKCPMIELRGPGSNSTVNGLNDHLAGQHRPQPLDLRLPQPDPDHGLEQPDRGEHDRDQPRRHLRRLAAAHPPRHGSARTVWYGNDVVLAYNAVRRQQIGFLIAERRQPLPQVVTQIGNVFESNGTDVIFRPVTDVE